MLKNKFCYLIIFLSSFLSFPIQALNPLLPPSGNFDLSAWKLQTLDANLAFTEIQANTLTNSYSSSLFYTNNTDGSLVFNVPSNGTPTSGSTYPRVELRQMTGGANWILTDVAEHYLTAQCKVLSVASAKPQTIIGQIHGSATVSELLKLRWTGYQPKQCFVEARFKSNDANMTEFGVTLASGLSLGDLITYTITMKSGVVIVTVNGTSTSQTYTADIWGTSDQYYFKAGNYFQYNNQVVPDPTQIWGINQFYKISLIKSITDVENPEITQFCIVQNPVQDKLQLRYYLASSITVKFTIFDQTGKQMENYSPVGNLVLGENTKSLNMSGLKSGVYFLKVQSDHLSKTLKFFVLK
jgi:hypothetical protein